MPYELQQYHDSLPSSMVNNSRSIVKGTWNRIKGKHPVTVCNIIRKEYGISLDIDYSPSDLGIAPLGV